MERVFESVFTLLFTVTVHEILFTDIVHSRVNSVTAVTSWNGSKMSFSRGQICGDQGIPQGHFWEIFVRNYGDQEDYKYTSSTPLLATLDIEELKKRIILYTFSKEDSRRKKKRTGRELHQPSREALFYLFIFFSLFINMFKVSIYCFIFDFLNMLA